MKWKLRLSSKAAKEIAKLDRAMQTFIVEELEFFIQNFDEAFENELIASSKIKHLKGEYAGFYRLRLRSYRVIYEKINNELVIQVVRVAHRKEAY